MEQEVLRVAAKVPYTDESSSTKPTKVLVRGFGGRGIVHSCMQKHRQYMYDEGQESAQTATHRITVVEIVQCESGGRCETGVECVREERVCKHCVQIVACHGFDGPQGSAVVPIRKRDSVRRSGTILDQQTAGQWIHKVHDLQTTGHVTTTLQKQTRNH